MGLQDGGQMNYLVGMIRKCVLDIVQIFRRGMSIIFRACADCPHGINAWKLALQHRIPCPSLQMGFKLSLTTIAIASRSTQRLLFEKLKCKVLKMLCCGTFAKWKLQKAICSA
ncbi:hypothetical protein CEXT_368591 [Caerostris extrusa]|uniref:Uncharacterized protein n=1 Tax=Caerostris extrusa TaxID=172846 RepID=A0AAV4MK16_CAEEX|nr:hypothetical protein CEXT_368591 [Caerostris extrusa]